MSLPNEINPTGRILMGPGPSDVDPSTSMAMARPMIGHLDPQFIAIMDETKAMLQQVFKTGNQLTIPVSAPGSAGMETCLVNLLEPGDEALVCVHGVFGTRMCDIVERCGAKLHRIDAPWGTPIAPAQVKEALSKCSPKLVAIVHAETSTGVLQPLEEISEMVHKSGALFVVDAVTSLGGVDVRVDEWGIDAIAKMPERASGNIAGILRAARSGGPRCSENQSAELVPRSYNGSQLLGRWPTRLPPHCTRLFDLCHSSSAASGSGRGTRKQICTTPRESRATTRWS
jgi:aspartate aminotransferase-like enzyme